MSSRATWQVLPDARAGAAGRARAQTVLCSTMLAGTQSGMDERGGGESLIILIQDAGSYGNYEKTCGAEQTLQPGRCFRPSYLPLPFAGAARRALLI